jgi:hypothetical protein
MKTTFEIPKQPQTDVSVRRLQQLTVKPGGSFTWAYGSARGDLKADAEGVITIPGLTITAEPTTLTITK